jgi:hypothetical protein
MNKTTVLVVFLFDAPGAFERRGPYSTQPQL